MAVRCWERIFSELITGMRAKVPLGYRRHCGCSFSPDVTTRSVLATPAQGAPRHTKALMYLSFQACGCWLRKYRVYMFPML
ncbi:unnamed protein product [Menidia menidia]|uniref:(Atlantic silverside) hypothetical protein n=1 Tax=Menidia menidia TaxID=238744 RepID=A0A8S4BCX6_9TELE|nr:unnamed protein product [Menidia menidia]